jgi:hypothetical protein
MGLDCVNFIVYDDYLMWSLVDEDVNLYIIRTTYVLVDDDFSHVKNAFSIQS